MLFYELRERSRSFEIKANDIQHIYNFVFASLAILRGWVFPVGSARNYLVHLYFPLKMERRDINDEIGRYRYTTHAHAYSRLLSLRTTVRLANTIVLPLRGNQIFTYRDAVSLDEVVR